MSNRFTFRNYNLADWFSFYRIASAPVLTLVLFAEFRVLFSWLLLVSYITDAADGYLARRLKISSSRGSQLDSIGDQFTFLLGVIGIFIFEYQFILEQYLWLVLGLGLYCVQLLLALKKYGKASAFHTYLAKVSAVIQSIFILYSLFYQPVEWAFLVMVFIGVLELIEEIVLIFIFDTWRADVKGLYWALKQARKS